MTLYILRGVPGSGKSTYARAWQSLSPEKRCIISRDDIRSTIFSKRWGLTHQEEEIVTKAQHAAIKAALNAGYDVMVHDTNLRAKTVRGFYALSEFVEVIDIPVERDEAKRRDAEREHSVGPEVIDMFFDKYMRGGKFPPVPERGATDHPITPYVPPKGIAPCAILVDVDGTLADHHGIRDPHDTTLYHLDQPHEHIVRLVRLLSERYTIIIFSAREAAYRDVLEQWLEDHRVPFDHIFMRPTGDKREDSIVKNEMFDQHIAGEYSIPFILDDRDRVVRMWRAKGLKVLQVADGNF